MIQVGGPSIGSPGPGPDRLSFGEVAIGATSAPQMVEVRSRESYAVTIVGVRIGGDAGFRLQDDRCSGATLQPQGSGGCSVAVAFTPQREGFAEGAVIVAMTHTCTATTYEPCSWGPERQGSFTREVLANGQMVFNWRSGGYRLNGTGTS